jgi:hypothetical protein
MVGQDPHPRRRRRRQFSNIPQVLLPLYSFCIKNVCLFTAQAATAGSLNNVNTETREEFRVCQVWRGAEALSSPPINPPPRRSHAAKPRESNGRAQ